MKYLFLAGLLYLLYKLGWQVIRRKLHGEPPAETAGPRTITLIALAIVIIYGIWVVARLLRAC